MSDVLLCLNDTSGTIVADPDLKLRVMLVEQRDKMVERIAFLEQNRDALTRYLDAMDAPDTHRRKTGEGLPSPAFRLTEQTFSSRGWLPQILPRSAPTTRF